MVEKVGKVETITCCVAPSDEDDFINRAAIFGWDLKSSQEVYSQDSHLETHSDTLYSVTETTNYVKLVFCRDKGIGRDADVSRIENEYWEQYAKYKKFPKGMSFKLKALFIGFPLLSCIAICGNGGNFLDFLSVSPLLILGIGIVVGWKKLVTDKAVEKCLKADKRCTELEEELESLNLGI